MKYRIQERLITVFESPDIRFNKPLLDILGDKKESIQQLLRINNKHESIVRNAMEGHYKFRLA
jgi:SET domain-containing protein